VLPFLALAIFIICFVTLYNPPKRKKLTLEQILTEPNYYLIARMEKAIWDGNSFHSTGWGATDHGYCQCNTICHPETFYIPTAQPPISEDLEEWRDRYGE
jgi:hypothetical protein